MLPSRYWTASASSSRTESRSPVFKAVHALDVERGADEAADGGSCRVSAAAARGQDVVGGRQRVAPAPSPVAAQVWVRVTAAEFPNIQADLVNAGYALSRHVPIDDSSAYVRMSATIKCIHEFLAKDKPLVQVITVKTDSALKAVDTFDITACQVYYVPSQRLIAAASPDAWTALLNRQIVFSESSLKTQAPVEWIRTLKRVCKYLKRGFAIEDAQWARMLTAVSERLLQGAEAQWLQSGNRHGQTAGVRFAYTPQDGFKFITR